MQELLNMVVQGQRLSVEQTTKAFELIMTGQASGAQVGALLAMIQQRHPTADELTGAATVMRQKVKQVEVPDGLTVIDTCGTGGDHSGTFNISTAAALVSAAAGHPRGVVVAKHGNRSITSQSGSSQVLEALGVKIQVDGPTLTRCLREAGICFCFAPGHHPSMKHAMPVRQELGFRTIFNLLGPLTNPAGASRQVIGVFSEELTDLLAEVLGRLGSIRAMVVHGQFDGGGLDELSTCGTTRVSHLKQGQVSTESIDPQSLGLASGKPDDLRVNGPRASADLIRQVLNGQAGPSRDIVCLNAAAALWVADIAKDLGEGLELAAGAIDGGAASATLERLVQTAASAPSA